MKTKLFLLFLFLLPLPSFSQKVNNILISDLKSEYIEISPTGGLFANFIYIDVNYGQQHKFLNDFRIKDNYGKPIKFNSIIDALNFFHKFGYEYVDKFQKDDTTSYLLKRKNNSEDLF